MEIISCSMSLDAQRHFSNIGGEDENTHKTHAKTLFSLFRSGEIDVHEICTLAWDGPKDGPIQFPEKKRLLIPKVEWNFCLVCAAAVKTLPLSNSRSYQ